jgi:hypothetical protein
MDGVGVKLGGFLNLHNQCNEKSASCSGSFNPQKENTRQTFNRRWAADVIWKNASFGIAVAWPIANHTCN